MKLNSRKPKKRMPNSTQKIRHKQQFINHRPRKGRKQKSASITRIGKPSPKKRKIIIRKKRQLSWKSIRLLFLLLFLILILGSLFFRR